MLSGVLNSPRAVEVNIGIMRVFVRLRRLLGSNAGLARKLAALEKKYDAQFGAVFDAIREPMEPEEDAGKGRIDFRGHRTAVPLHGMRQLKNEERVPRPGSRVPLLL